MNRYNGKNLREHRIEFYQRRNHRIINRYTKRVKSKYHTLIIHMDSMGLIRGILRHSLDHLRYCDLKLYEFIQYNELFRTHF